LRFTIYGLFTIHHWQQIYKLDLLIGNICINVNDLVIAVRIFINSKLYNSK